jgi:hypothetical protein
MCASLSLLEPYSLVAKVAKQQRWYGKLGAPSVNALRKSNAGKMIERV